MTMITASGWIFDENIRSTPGSPVRCRPLSAFPDINECQGFLCQPCQLEDLVELPILFTSIDVPEERGFEVPVICAWCGVVIRYKTGFAQDGTSHGMCEQCFEERMSQKID
jgi:hypothetical protein